MIQKKQNILPSFTLRIVPMLLIVAMIGLVALTGCKKKATKKVAQTQDVFAEYFEPYADVTATRDLSNESELKFKEAMNFYNQKDYTKAIPAFEALAGESEDIKVNFYTGISYLANGQAKDAAAQLRTVIEDDDNSYDTQAKWYLALACLDLDQDEEAVPVSYTHLTLPTTPYV